MVSKIKRWGQVGALGSLALGLGGQVAHADRIDDAQRKLGDLDEKSRLLQGDFRDNDKPDPNLAERRVVEAETLFQLGNYFEAATISLDVIEKFPNTRAYDDAIYLLGESLYKDGNFLSARKFFSMGGRRGSGSVKEQKALQRIVEIAMRTDDYTGIDDVFARLARIPLAQLEPSVPYVRGKYLFTRGKFDEALLGFAQIPPTSPYYMQARYFIATTLIKRGDAAGAMAGFDEVLRLAVRTDSEKEIQDLARLALGRLNYQEARLDLARQAYDLVPRESKHYGDAKFEQAWSAIKAGDFKNAYRALDLMLLQDPSAPHAPDLKLLIGNLHNRMENFTLAEAQFKKTLAEYEPVYLELKLTHEKASADPKYFDALLAKGIEKFDVASIFPKGAIAVALSEPDVAKLVELSGSVSDLTRDIRESEHLLGRLERAINGGSRVGAFADLAGSRGKSVEIVNQVVLIRSRFAGEARNLAAQYVSPEDKTTLDQIAAERLWYDEQAKKLPTTTDGLRDRNIGMRGQFSALDDQASEMNVIIQSLDAELVAMEQYFVLSKADQKIRPDDLKQPISAVHDDIAVLRKKLEDVRNDIVDASQEASMAGAAGTPDKAVTDPLTRLFRREQDILLRGRAAMSGGGQQELDRYLAVLGRCEALQQQLQQFDTRLDTAADRRLVGIREQLQTEKNQLVIENTKLGAVSGESQGVGGGLAQAMHSKITDLFHNLTVQSDVGLIDVAWGMKDEKSNILSKLVGQQKLELKSLQDDFDSLLKAEKGDKIEEEIK